MKVSVLKIGLICSLIFVTSCSQNKDEMLKNLPGYWEIESVKTESGTLKKFKISTTIDFIELHGDKGLRTKVNPQLDGSFINNETTENFTIVSSDKKLVLTYDNDYSKWTEEILQVTDDTMVVKNEEGKEYRYKRFEGFDFNKE